MGVRSLDHVGVVVDDLEAAIAFFVDVGLEREEAGTVEGEWVDKIVGLDGVRAEVVFVRTPVVGSPWALLVAVPFTLYGLLTVDEAGPSRTQSRAGGPDSARARGSGGGVCRRQRSPTEPHWGADPHPGG